MNKGMLLLALASVLNTAHAEDVTKAQSKFEKYKQARLQSVSSFNKAYLKRYEDYSAKLKEKWGVPELSSKKEFITYSADKNVKVYTDFESDVIEITVLEPSSETDTDQYLTDAIYLALNTEIGQQVNFQPEFNLPTLSSKTVVLPEETAPHSLLSSVGITHKDSLAKLVKQAEVKSAEEQQKVVIERTKERLETQVESLTNYAERDDLSESNKSTKALINTLKQEQVVLSKAEKVAKLTKKNTKTYTLNLNRSRALKAKPFIDSVNKAAAEWQVSPEFILAVMETESSFNPLAKSHIPAYGLMQIVPSTAGLDVNQKLFNDQQKPKVNVLYKENENIRYGSGYIHILLSQYLKGVKDPQSKLYCAIAAYNTGIGNLAKAFNKGEKGHHKAIANINKLSPEEVYNVLKKRTHKETQRYLDKVLNSKQYFAQQKVSA